MYSRFAQSAIGTSLLLGATAVASLLAGVPRSPAEGTAPGGARIRRSDRGDVPGWVLITVMTAALVVALWALAGEAFTTFFRDSMDKVRKAA